MKILLANLPNEISIVKEGRCMQRKGAWTAVWAPITLATTAALLREKGFEVKIIDSSVENISVEGMLDYYNSYASDLLVINTATPSIEGDLGFAARLKESNKRGVKIAAIGIHVTVLPDDCLKTYDGLDFIVRGEPEFTLLELVQALLSKKDLSKIKGISYKQDGLVIHNEDRGFDSNLDTLPFPAWDLIDINKYQLPFKGRPFLLVSTGKGCPYDCIFCCGKPYYGSKLRLRAPERVVDEIAWLGERFGIKDFLFWTESFTMNNDFSKTICNEIIRRKLKVEWVCNSRVDTVTPELLRSLKEAGCWMIGYGVESSDQRILDNSKKGIKVEQIVNAIKWAKEAGLEVTAHTIFGLPGETKESIKNTMSFLKRHNVDFVQIYCAVPFPGSKLYDMAKKNNWLLSSDWSLYEQNFSIINLREISAKEIMKLRKKAIIGFYLRPTKILNALLRIKRVKDLRLFMSMLKDFITWI